MASFPAFPTLGDKAGEASPSVTEAASEPRLSLWAIAKPETPSTSAATGLEATLPQAQRSGETLAPGAYFGPFTQSYPSL
uniref:Uncharacterized protein n=1 Tax=Desertifilum tharense IPPAS B-1220 TaxID=1781255 RepID=A0ACD5GXX6_9CYAN